MSFDKVVRDYEAWYRTPFGRYADNLEKKLVFRFLGMVMEKGILDVGCGTGNYSTVLARQGARVVGLDSSMGMLNFTKGKARRNELDIDFVLGDAEHLPFKNWSFDIVVSITALCFMKNPRRAVAEIKRVIKINGRIVVGDIGKWSLYGIKKKVMSKFRVSIYRKAKFHSPPELKSLFGKVEWGSTLFAPDWMPSHLLRIFARCEGSLSTPFKPFGAFLVAAQSKVISNKS